MSANGSDKVVQKKKLIEVALPLDAINEAAVREKSIRHGHPSTLHLWWARRPLAVARAIIFAQMVDDPSSHPDLFPTEKLQEKERQRLFRIIESLVLWESTKSEAALQPARDEIWQSWRATCAENADHPRAKDLFNRHGLPGFHDPFAGGGALPLEAQRLGLDSYASDLNPVAVLICKAMIELPPKFADQPPVNPDARGARRLLARQWPGAEGLAEDVRYYGQRVRDEGEKRIGHLYPKIEVTADMARARPDLKGIVGQKLTVIAWLWARTVKSPNPAFAHVYVPLVSSFVLSSRVGKEAYVEPVVKGDRYQFLVRLGKPPKGKGAGSGTKISRGSFRCLLSDVPIPYAYIDDEANADRLSRRLLAIVCEGAGKRVYLSPTDDANAIAEEARPTWKPDAPSRGTWASNAQGRRYGFRTFGDYFTARQLVALTTFSELVQEARDWVKDDALAAGLSSEGGGVDSGATGATAYADTIALYLAFSVDKAADYWSTVCSWHSSKELIRNTFGRQGIPMTWDYAETNVFSDSTGNVSSASEWAQKALRMFPAAPPGLAAQADAQEQRFSTDRVVSTDPPYYDNIGYADLSDFFYVWLRHSLRPVFPELFGTLAVPKEAELVATQHRHGTKAKAEAFFLIGMTRAMHRIATLAHPAFPVTIYYAFKQAETDEINGTSSTGWDTFLEAVIQAGFAITGTWPVRTELGNRMVSSGTNALASSIVLVCRRRRGDATMATRRDFAAALKRELPAAVAHLQRGNIAPVDLAQAAIGPGMAIYTRYAKVRDAEGKEVSVRDALALINQTLDEALSEHESDFDTDSRWALTWFEQSGFAEGEYGVAEQLSKSKNTSLAGMVEAGILASSRGKVRLLRPDELPANWNPATDSRLSAWEIVHQLVRVLGSDGEGAAAELVAKLGANAEVARELCYRLYAICERKKRAPEALAYNSLVQSWPEITRLAREGGRPQSAQTALFGEPEEE